MPSIVEKYRLPAVAEEQLLKEYSYLLYIAGIIIYVHPKVWVISVATTFLFIVLSLFYFFTLIVTCAKATTFVGFSQALNYASLICISLGLFFFSGLTNRQAVIRLMEIIHEDFYDYGESFKCPEVAGWKKSHRSFKIIIFACIPVYLCLIAASVVFGTYIDHQFFGYDTPDIDYINGIYQKTPIKVWYPIGIDSLFLRLVATLSQMLQAAILALTLSCGDILMLFWGQAVGLQLRILCLAATKTDERAKAMYQKETAGHSNSDKKQVLNECYRRCIKQLVEHHLIIKEFYTTYYKIAKWPTAIAFMNGSLMIAMSILVTMNGSEEPPSTYISATLLLLAEIMSMWLLCETGHNVNIWSEELFNAIYEFEWMDMSISNKKMMMIFKENIKKPLLMMAGGLTPINRDTFGTIMNTSYSYVNLLLASDKKKPK